MLSNVFVVTESPAFNRLIHDSHGYETLSRAFVGKSQIGYDISGLAADV